MEAYLVKKKIIAEKTMEMTFLVNEDFSFLPGQYVKMRVPLLYTDSKDRRKFSIVNAPIETKNIIIAFRQTESGYKKTLSEMPIGSQVEIDRIKGDLLLEDSSLPLVFIAGGIGITPFMSMFLFLREKQKTRNVTLFYFNRTKQSTAYFSDLEKLDKEDHNFKVVFSMTQQNDWEGERRKLSEGFLTAYEVDKKSIFYIVGTPRMVSEAEKVIQDWGVERTKIKIEDFEGYV